MLVSGTYHPISEYISDPLAQVGGDSTGKNNESSSLKRPGLLNSSLNTKVKFNDL